MTTAMPTQAPMTASCFVESLFHGRKTSTPVVNTFPQTLAKRGGPRQIDGMRERSPIGTRVDQMLEARGWTQSELSRQSGVAVAVLSCIVSGKSEAPSNKKTCSASRGPWGSHRIGSRRARGASSLPPLRRRFILDVFH